MKNPTLFKKSSTQMGGGKLLLISILTPFFMFAQNQQNTLPTSGNVGVGTTSPDVKLQVNGRLRVDSSLLVKDSAVFEKRAHIKDRIVVDEDAIIKGKLVARDKLKVKGTAKFEGNVKFPNLSTINSNDTTLLFVNHNGKLKKGSIVNLLEQVGSSPQAIPVLKDIIYSTQAPACLTDGNGNIIYTPPHWMAGGQSMYIKNATCHPNVRLGVGIEPDAKLHLLASKTSAIPQILVENAIPGSTTEKIMELEKNGAFYTRTMTLSPDYVAPNTFSTLTINNPNRATAITINATSNSQNYNKLIFAKFDGTENTEIFNIIKEGESKSRFYMKTDGSFYIYNGTKKLLQMNTSGLLHTREVKVDLNTWPDYVFHKEYKLLPLNELQNYIKTLGHLPNVPSAEEVKKNGLNLGDAAKTSMQKIEELTLYLIQLNKKVEKQGKTLQQQKDLIQAQQKTIALQKKLIEWLKEEKLKQ